MIELETVIKRAETLCAVVPVRDVSDDTARAYEKTFTRMWNSNDLDPLKDGAAMDTYYHRRAALHFGGRLLLTRLIDQLLAAAARQDHALEQEWARKLLRAVERLEPVFALDPPAPANILPWECPPSRWRQSPNADRPRGENSKKTVLRYLPEDWDQRLWTTAMAMDGWTHRDALAVHLVAPPRPEELVPGRRPTGWSPGVLVELRSMKCLAITFAPVKSEEGVYGTEITEICIDPTVWGGAATFLAERCLAPSGRIIISIQSKNAVRKALARLGRKALPELDGVVITPYVLRHQLIADIKATRGGGEEVAIAAGHCTDRTQAHYANFEHGRKRKGFLSFKAARPPRCGNVERARQLSRRHARHRNPQ